MADAPYLVAMALVEFAGMRALPLTGKSQAAAAADAVDPGDDGRTLALELLLRLWLLKRILRLWNLRQQLLLLLRRKKINLEFLAAYSD